MADVEIRDLHKSYGAVEVMHGVSISIAAGEFVALVGPSGCGKSTLLRMVAGLEEVTSGEILIGGEVVNDIAPGDRDIAMVFQSYALYPHMTARKNMAFSLRLAKFDKAEIARRVDRAAEILGLESVLDRLPGELSGGQRQRVAMGRAIVRDPVAFLFDEPLSNLDAKLRVQMRAEIKDLHQRLGTTTIYVTHDQIEAMTLADKVVVLNAGRIEQQGTPLELYDTPTTLFVAGFIGSPSMNFIRGRVAASAGRILVTDDGMEVELPAVRGLEAGRKITLGFRPEDLSLGDKGIPCTIQVVEPTGAETHVLARSQAGNVTAVFRERHPLSHGMSVTMSPDLAKAHVFDTETGFRLDFSS